MTQAEREEVASDGVMSVEDAATFDRPAALAAFQAFLRLSAAKPADSPTAAEAVVRFLADCEARGLEPVTVRGYRTYLKPFLTVFGSDPVGTLTPVRIEASARRPTWNDTTRNIYLATVDACLKYAGVTLKIRRPPKRSRGAEAVIPAEVYQKLLLVCVGDWRQVIRFLWHTGCRPSEASAVRAEFVDLEAGVVRLPKHKTAHKGKQRLVVLDETAAAVLREQLAKHRSGPLFRGKGGKPFSRAAFTMKFTRLTERVGHHVTSYGFRHSFATRALAAGESDAVVAALLGHGSTAMIHKNYSHLSENARVMKEAIDRISRRAV